MKQKFPQLSHPLFFFGENAKRTSLFRVREVAVEGDGLSVALRLVALFPLPQNVRPLRPLLANPRGLEVSILQAELEEYILQVWLLDSETNGRKSVPL